MLDPSTALRDAYLENLDNTIIIDGVPIPAYDEQLPVNAPVGLIRGASCYILIKNQTEADSSVKCLFANDCSITVDINTKFPKSKGGKYLSEVISNEVQKLIYESASGNNLNLTPDFNCLSTRKELGSGLIEYNVTNTNFRKIIVFLHTIDQLVNDTIIT